MGVTPTPVPLGKPERAPANTAVEIGGVQVTVGGSRAERYLMVMAVVGVRDATRSVRFRGWRGSGLAVDEGVVVRDEFGNRYEHAAFGAGDMAAAGLPEQNGVLIGPGQVTSEVRRAEALLFDAPVPAATYVDIDLPGAAVGVDGVYRFRLNLAAK